MGAEEHWKKEIAFFKQRNNNGKTLHGFPIISETLPSMDGREGGCYPCALGKLRSFPCNNQPHNVKGDVVHLLNPKPCVLYIFLRFTQHRRSYQGYSKYIHHGKGNIQHKSPASHMLKEHGTPSRPISVNLRLAF